MSLDTPKEPSTQYRDYQTPQIILEIELETRAGTGLSLPDFEEDFEAVP
jgi:hypothetical protein